MAELTGPCVYEGYSAEESTDFTSDFSGTKEMAGRGFHGLLVTALEKGFTEKVAQVGEAKSALGAAVTGAGLHPGVPKLGPK